MLDVGRIGGNREHLSPDLAYRLVHDCTHRKDLDSGRRLHSLMIQNGLDSAPLLANHLIRLYADCGKLIEANNTFNRLSNPDRYSWNAVIDAHAKLEGGQLYHEMQNAGISPDKFTFLALLRACNSLPSIEPGRVVHGQIFGSYLQSDPVVENSLINMYAKCGNSEEAERVLNISRSPNVISWNAIIALICFKHMQLNGVQYNQITLLSILKACGSINGIQHARWIHDQILDILNKDDISYTLEVNMENTLIDVYAKCGSLEEAIRVFGNLRNKKDVVSLGIMVSGYVENAEYKLALECFKEMHKEGKKPNNVTFIMTLKACCNIGELQKGKCIHEQVIKCERQSDLAIGSTLVDMYTKCGDMQEAYGVFCRLKNRNVVSWNSMIAGYVQHEQGHFALECFKIMQYDGIKPDKVTYLSILKACGSIGSIEKCKYFHEGIIEIGLQNDNAVGSAIVDMYAKCKNLDVAYKAFQILPNRNVVTWNAIIAGYAQNDQGLLALDCFESMQREGTNPNEYTFSSILKASSKVGAIELGRGIHKIIIRSGI